MKIITIFCLTLVFISCNSINQSWSIPQDETDNAKATLTLSDIQIDRTGGKDSLEKEAANLAPLYFWEQRYKVVSAAEHPDYAAQIHIRERDFSLGWKSKKSLAVEVHIWPFEDQPENNGLPFDHKLPVSVGRVVTTKNESFSSSKTMSSMLSKAIKQAADKLAASNR